MGKTDQDSNVHFGNLLQIFLEGMGVKRGKLADSLGYDISYISRWVNGQKLPAIHNNYHFFRKIAVCLQEEGGSNGRENIAHIFSIDPDMPEDEFTDWIANQLSVAYNADVENKEQAPRQTDSTSNCILFSPSWSYEENWKSIFKTLHDEVYDQGSKELSIFIHTSNDDFIDHACQSFWHSILRALPEGTRLKVQMAVSFKNKDTISDICRDICIFYTLMMDSISLQLYNNDIEDADFSLWLCREKLAVITFYDKVLHINQTIISNEGRLLDGYEKEIGMYLRGRQQLMQPIDFPTLVRKDVLSGLVFKEGILGISSVMPLSFLDEQLFKDAVCRTGALVENAIWMRIMNFSDEKQRILLYSSALLQFFQNRMVSYWRYTIQLTVTESVSLLKRMKENLLGHSGNLKILNDSNPLLDRENFEGAVLIGKSDMILNSCAVSESDNASAIEYSSDKILIEAFRSFHEAIWNLQEPFIMPAEDAAALLEQGIQLLLKS